MRFIDSLVELTNISKLDFAIKTIKTEGCPSFNSKVFLKIYLYSSFNGIRSARDLEKESLGNIEMEWLLEDIRYNQLPQHYRFQKKQPSCFKEHFQTICFVLERC